MTTFTELPLSAALQQKLAAAQFITLTPIQARAISPALEGKDVIGTAQTGTGKTLAFLIPIIEMLRAESSNPESSKNGSAKNVRALVLLPTRELAMQVHEQYEQLRDKKMPKAALVIGGVSEKAQIQSLRGGQRRQTLCYSATMEQSVASLVSDYTREPVRIALGSTLKPAESVQLEAYEVRPSEKLDVLRQLLYGEKGQTLIFTRTKRGSQRLAKELERDGFSAAMIHGDRTQSQRNAALSGFQEGRYQVLVATDIASRGLHCDDVAHVINYDLPKMAEDFIHRVGRTGRAGSQGRASTLVTGAEVLDLRNIERTLKLRIERKQINAAAANDRPKRFVENTLASRTLTALPGEVFV